MVPFGCAVERGTCTAWIELTGELDLASAPELRERLTDTLADSTLVILDLRHLSFIDCAGLRVIREASETAAAALRRPIVIRGSRHVDMLLALTGLSDTLNVVIADPSDGHLAPYRPSAIRVVADTPKLDGPTAAAEPLRDDPGTTGAFKPNVSSTDQASVQASSLPRRALETSPNVAPVSVLSRAKLGTRRSRSAPRTIRAMKPTS